MCDLNALDKELIHRGLAIYYDTVQLAWQHHEMEWTAVEMTKREVNAVLEKLGLEQL